MATQEETLNDPNAFLAAMENNVLTDTFDPPPPPAEEVQPEVIQPAAEVVTTEPEPAHEEVPAEQVTETIQEPVLTETTAQPQVIEKVVEKIVEKFPDMDESAKQLFEAIQNGREDELRNYLNEKYMDYSSMSDYDVVRAGLKKENPSWNDKRLDLEFKTKYDIPSRKDLEDIDQVEHPDLYEKAVAFNEEIDRKEMLLQMQAEDFRIALNAQKKNIEFPKITSEQPQVTSQEPSAEEIAEQVRQWESLVSSEVPKLSDFKFTVNGEEVTYKLTDEEKAGMSDTMKNFNAVDYLKKRGWFDQEGNPNVLRITEDVYKLDNEAKLMGSVATQIKTAAKKEVISKDIKNIDLENNSNTNVKVNKAFWEVALDAGN